MFGRPQGLLLLYPPLRSHAFAHNGVNGCAGLKVERDPGSPVGSEATRRHSAHRQHVATSELAPELDSIAWPAVVTRPNIVRGGGLACLILTAWR